MSKLIIDATWGTGRPEDGTLSGRLTVLLLTEVVPKTCAHFINLVKSGAYSENAGFYRIGKDFMIQGGLGKGALKIPQIQDEFTTPLIENRPGTISVANRGPNTGSSEFFINTRGLGTKEAPSGETFGSENGESLNFLKAPKADKNWNHWLDGKHPVFGAIVDEDELDFAKGLSEISLREGDNVSAGSPTGSISMKMSLAEGNDSEDEKRALDFLGFSKSDFKLGAEKDYPRKPSGFFGLEKKEEKGAPEKKEPAWRKFF